MSVFKKFSIATGISLALAGTALAQDNVEFATGSQIGESVITPKENPTKTIIIKEHGNPELATGSFNARLYDGTNTKTLPNKVRKITANGRPSTVEINEEFGIAIIQTPSNPNAPTDPNPPSYQGQNTMKDGANTTNTETGVSSGSATQMGTTSGLNIRTAPPSL